MFTININKTELKIHLSYLQYNIIVVRSHMDIISKVKEYMIKKLYNKKEQFKYVQYIFNKEYIFISYFL